MKKFLLILVFLMITNFSFSQKWECIKMTKDGELIQLINKQNILIKDNVLYCWIKLVYVGETKKKFIDEFQSDDNTDFSNLSYHLMYTAFDISNNKIAVISSVYYSSDGRVIKSYDFSENITFDIVVPDTEGEALMEVAKKYYNQKKKGKKQTVSK